MISRPRDTVVKPIILVSLFSAGFFLLLMGFQNCAKGVISKDLGSSSQSSTNVPDSQSDDPPLVEWVHVFSSLPLDIQAIDNDTSRLLGPNVIRETNPDFFRAFNASGEKVLISDATFMVDPSRTYTISGLFRSVGTPASLLYFGIVPFGANEQEIYNWEYNRAGTPATISSATATEITVTGTLGGWQTGAVAAQRRSVGFYFDGNTNHLPDYVHVMWDDPLSMDSTQGGYSSAVGAEVSLNGSLPTSILAKIAKNPQTVVMQHLNTQWHIYPAAQNVSVPSAWTTISGTITGEVFSPTANQFPVGIKFAKIVILGNFTQADTAKLLFTNLKVTVK